MNTVTHRQVLHALNIWKQEKLRASCHHFMNTGANFNEVLSLHSGIVLCPAVLLHHAKQNNWKHDCKPETIDLTQITTMERSKKGEKWKNNDNITQKPSYSLGCIPVPVYIYSSQFLQDISHLKLNDSPATQHSSFLVSQYWQKLNAKNTTHSSFQIFFQFHDPKHQNICFVPRLSFTVSVLLNANQPYLNVILQHSFHKYTQYEPHSCYILTGWYKFYFSVSYCLPTTSKHPHTTSADCDASVIEPRRKSERPLLYTLPSIPWVLKPFW